MEENHFIMYLIPNVPQYIVIKKRKISFLLLQYYSPKLIIFEVINLRRDTDENY